MKTHRSSEAIIWESEEAKVQESDTDFSDDRGKVDQPEREEKEKVLLHVDTLWSFERERGPTATAQPTALPLALTLALAI